MSYYPKSYHKLFAAAVSAAMVTSSVVTLSPISASAEEGTLFSDVKPSDYFYDAVHNLTSREIIKGYEDGTYRPYASVTRAQAAKILALTLGLDITNVKNPGFIDVKSSDWYYGSVAALVEAGIMNGYGVTFKPQETLTRAQMAKIITLGFKFGEAELTNNPFKDVKSSDWFAAYLPALITNEITTGKTADTFDPSSHVTRGQLAAFVFRSEAALNPNVIESEIVNITNTSIELTSGTYALTDDQKKWLNPTNLQALKGAIIEVDVKDGKVERIKSVEITANGTASDSKSNPYKNHIVIDGNEATLEGNLIINGDYVSIKNMTILGNLEVGEEVKSSFYTEGLLVEGKTIISETAKSKSTTELSNFYKSLSYKVSADALRASAAESKENSPVVVFVDTNLQSVEVLKSGTTIESKGTTSVKEIRVSSNVILKADKGVKIPVVTLKEAAAHVTIDASVDYLTIETDEDLTVNGKGNISNVTIDALGEIKLETEGKIDKLEIKSKNSNVFLGKNLKVNDVSAPEGSKLKDVIDNYNDVKGNIKKFDGKENPDAKKSSGGGGGSSNNSNNPTPPPPVVDGGIVYDAAGTFGPSDGEPIQVINGDVTIAADDVILQNVKVKGNLIISESVGEGEVTLKGVTVEGNTTVLGGGMNSVYFVDTVLATVIVNKNNGAIRIVAEGRTTVSQVVLESTVKIEESNLAGNAPGFTDLVLSDNLQSTDPNLQVELVGQFDTINSRAAQVRMTLPENTSVEQLILSAAASILGQGRVTSVEVYTSGSSMERMPEEVLIIPGLNGTPNIEIDGETIDRSQSNADYAELNNIKVTPSYIALNLNRFVDGITLNDFNITAKLNGVEIDKEDLSLQYDSNLRVIKYTPYVNGDNIGSQLSFMIEPKSGPTEGNPDTRKVRGEGKTGSVVLSTGASGRITDIYGAPAANATIEFRPTTSAGDTEPAASVTTDRNGLYSVNLEPGTYTGKITGTGYIDTDFLVTVRSNHFNSGQHGTAIRAAASNATKIMLSWNGNESDVDSHLLGPTVDGEEFHIYFSEKTYSDDGFTYVDLDWDDTDYYGPETTTIRKWTDGRYVFYVHNWSGENPLSESQSVVKVFEGNTNTPLHTFNVPENSGSPEYWAVFELLVSNNGSTFEYKPIETMISNENWLLDPEQSLRSYINDSEGQILARESYSESYISELIQLVDEAKEIVNNPNSTTKEILDRTERIYTQFNHAPSLYNNLIPLTVGHPLTITASSLAYDRDGDDLDFTGVQSSDDSSIATVARNLEGELVINPLAEGTTTITVNITDGIVSTPLSFDVYVSELSQEIDIETMTATTSADTITLSLNNLDFSSIVSTTSDTVEIGDANYSVGIFEEGSLNNDDFRVDIQTLDIDEDGRLVVKVNLDELELDKEYNAILFGTDGTIFAESEGFSFVDNIAPAILDAYPDYRNDTGASVDLLLGTDEASTAYYVVLPADEVGPTKDQVIAGVDSNNQPVLLSGSTSLPANTEKVVTISGLAENESYHIYVVAVDSSGNKSILHNRVLNRGDQTSPTFEEVPIAEAELEEGFRLGTTSIGYYRPANGNTLEISVSDTSVDTPQVGDPAPDNTTPYNSGEDILASEGQYLQMYELNSDNEIVTFKEFIVEGDVIQSDNESRFVTESDTFNVINVEFNSRLEESTYNTSDIIQLFNITTLDGNNDIDKNDVDSVDWDNSNPDFPKLVIRLDKQVTLTEPHIIDISFNERSVKYDGIDSYLSSSSVLSIGDEEDYQIILKHIDNIVGNELDEISAEHVGSWLYDLEFYEQITDYKEENREIYQNKIAALTSELTIESLQQIIEESNLEANGDSVTVTTRNDTNLVEAE